MSRNKTNLLHFGLAAAGLIFLWHGMAPRTGAQSGWTEPYVYDIAQEVAPAECTPPGGDSDALGRTKLWDIEEILP